MLAPNKLTHATLLQHVFKGLERNIDVIVNEEIKMVCSGSDGLSA
ncbi:hypothetical protein MDMS009_2152 [Methylophaga thiooxydans DMS010]|uniref:Uncharacterized protein n=1 Tax=Methylophaga thiooxydans DMS010 TaxID=637616 RepID=C0N6F2_9GAMM|nr:hypothetical protein MDMS009_2152 [Methylophaga thiooxydans DMS010]